MVPYVTWWAAGRPTDFPAYLLARSAADAVVTYVLVQFIRSLIWAALTMLRSRRR